VGPHNTNFCKVDDSGHILSQDQVFANPEGDGIHSGGGGCIARPIRDVWGVYFNHPVMQPDDVDEYTATARPDLIPLETGGQILFVFDLYNVHHVPLINPAWTVRWYHAVQHGSFETPNQVSINFQKVDGTSYIRKLEGGYVLDRVTDQVTSWVMDQYADAERYDHDKAFHDVVRNFERMRQGASAIPASPQTH
jgi:hypothetical protein